MPNQNKQHILLSVGKMKLNWADAGKKKIKLTVRFISVNWLFISVKVNFSVICHYSVTVRVTVNWFKFSSYYTISVTVTVNWNHTA